jgi:hypothetical protein
MDEMTVDIACILSSRVTFTPFSAVAAASEPLALFETAIDSALVSKDPGATPFPEPLEARQCFLPGVGPISTPAVPP